jgi:AcrR family transcriptional regulator
MAGDTTQPRIVTAAIRLFLAQGVRKTNLADIAEAAGVTRVTIYRYFGDKKGLVREICLRIAGVFQHAAEGGPRDTVRDVDLRLNRLGEELSALPKGDLLARLDEISRLYPDIYEEFRTARQHAVDQVFQQALAAATHERTLREGLNPQIVKAIFWASVLGLIENPTVISSNVSLNEVFATVTEVFRHGILKDTTEGATNDHP